jgi:hypothetical protein
MAAIRWGIMFSNRVTFTFSIALTLFSLIFFFEPVCVAQGQSSGGISGGVTPAEVSAGAVISLLRYGSPVASTTVDANGNFAFSGLSRGSYQVVPAKNGVTFTPSSQSVRVRRSDVSGVDFSATGTAPTPAHAISGTISNGAGATVSLTGAMAATTTADANGNYLFSGLPDGGYTLSPTLTGYSLSPPNQAVNVAGADISGIDFTATTASTTHSVDLTWTASTTPTVSGYHVYRSSMSGGAYARITSAPVTSTLYTDPAVNGGTTYYYVVTAVDSDGTESAYSNEAFAVIPNP